MQKALKRLLLLLIFIMLLATAMLYGVLSLSLPSLSGSAQSASLSHGVVLERDHLGTAIIKAENRNDAAYALGYAHGQDRFFQMDLLRRNAAGELGSLFGDAVQSVDEERRFHQFRKRSQAAVSRLSEPHLALLTAYANGVNDALAQQTFPSFEYLLTRTQPKPWRVEDSFLTIYSMYLDLQGRGLERDLVIDAVATTFGEDMVAFLSQPSPYQAAIDGSVIERGPVPIPVMSAGVLAVADRVEIEKLPAVGSNNWAVAGSLTQSGQAMMSDDMHLGLNVPIIWYRAQLNFTQNGKRRQLTGVTLPGAPAVVVGTNGSIAWGFTNSYIDTADWYRLGLDDETRLETEVMFSKDRERKWLLETSDMGPVRTFNGKKYALSWVAHQDYAVNLNLLNLETAESVNQAVAVSRNIGIPAQNMVVADKQGAIGWQLVGAVPARTNPSQQPQRSSHFDKDWHQQAKDIPSVVNPDSARIWTANSRAVNAELDTRFGDGGYSLGARSQQIRERLFEKTAFDRDDFYAIQLDNQAKFLTPWHASLLATLKQAPQRFAADIEALENWGNCACADSVGYTLTRYYRDAMMDAAFAPIETALNEENYSLSLLERQLEPALWQLMQEQPLSWLPPEYPDWATFQMQTYLQMRDKLMTRMAGHRDGSLQALNWGDVNTLNVQHPFSRQIPVLSNILDMPATRAFGDRYMPAVQGRYFAASQRFIVQPGDEENAILTVPGGQSGHPLSPFYRSGFDDYVSMAHTSLLPGEPLYQIQFTPAPHGFQPTE